MSRPTVLFHVSDLHFGYEDRQALDWFAETVERERPDGVVCTGDLTMRGTAKEFALAAEWLTRLPVPVSIEPGNHDVPYYHLMLRRLSRPYAHFHALKHRLGSEIALPQVAVVSLKTIARAQFRLNWSKGRVSRTDLDAALHGLAQHREVPLKLVACHHPLVEAATHASASTRGGRRALAALARAGAGAVLSGHVHDPFDKLIEIEGQAIRIVGAGTLSQRLRRTRPSFNRLEWHGGKLTVTVRELD
jgi:3',5'-cyclic AMP phosphodiesterase CpdA